MSEHAVSVERQIPAWLADMEFCHIDDGSGEHAYCLDPSADGEITCDSFYEGAAICPTCGRPTCPRCAQLSALEDEMDA